MVENSVWLKSAVGPVLKEVETTDTLAESEEM